MAGMDRRWFGLMFVVVACFSVPPGTVTSSTGESTGTGPACQGDVGCACYGNATCNGQLRCVPASQVCVDPMCQPGTVHCGCIAGACMAELICDDDGICRQGSGSESDSESTSGSGITGSGVDTVGTGTAESTDGTTASESATVSADGAPLDCSVCSLASLAIHCPEQAAACQLTCAQFVDCFADGGATCCDQVDEVDRDGLDKLAECAVTKGGCDAACVEQWTCQ